MTKKEGLKQHLLEHSSYCNYYTDGSLELKIDGLRNSMALKIWRSDFMIPLVFICMYTVDLISVPIGLIEDFILYR